MNRYIKALQDYAKALREAAAAEKLLIGTCVSPAEAFGSAMEGRARKVELVLGRRDENGEYLN